MRQNNVIELGCCCGHHGVLLYIRITGMVSEMGFRTGWSLELAAGMTTTKYGIVVYPKCGIGLHERFSQINKCFQYEVETALFMTL